MGRILTHLPGGHLCWPLEGNREQCVKLSSIGFDCGVFVSVEGPAEPAKCGYRVSERELTGGAAEIQTAVG